MRYKVNFRELEESIISIDKKNDNIKETLTNLNRYYSNLKWKSTNRLIFDKKYQELVDNINDLTMKTDELIEMLKKKYQLFDDIYQNKMKKISKDPAEVEKIVNNEEQI
ncbi:MAG: hypothetical protein J6X02_01285 [Bacilli bacterium]|nr:hypothetical protein [Bacilli bacterium]